MPNNLPSEKTGAPSIPGTIQYESSMGKLKNPPISACENTQSEGLKTLLAVAGLLIAYKANSKE